MKKIFVVAVICLTLLVGISPSLIAREKDDFRLIQKAVSQNRDDSENRDIKWFKLTVIDAATKKEKARITMPVVLLEILADCSNGKPRRFDHYSSGVDFKTLLRELKKAGPMVLIEIYDDDKIVKVWLE